MPYDAPRDVVINFILFKVPYVFAQLGWFFGLRVVERVGMVSVACLKFAFDFGLGFRLVVVAASLFGMINYSGM